MVPRGVTHISLPLHEYDRGSGRKENKRTKANNMLGVNSEQKESMQHYISDSIYGLTLAWITSENSTKQLECWHLLTQSSSLDPIFSATVSGVDCPCPWFHTNCLWAVQPTLFRVPLPLLDTARFQVQKPFVWFRAKTDKGIVCLAGHLYSVTIPVVIDALVTVTKWLVEGVEGL